MKISVILPTYRKNNAEELNNLLDYNRYLPQKNEVDDRFKMLYWQFVKYDDCEQVGHILEPTLDCLVSQEFKDFEILLCHRYPEDVKDLMRYYEDKRFPNIRVIEEKPSIWHDLGNYATVNNIRNTGILHAKGELLFFIDDMMIFGPSLLQTVWENYKDRYYTTCKTTKRIKIEDDKLTGVEKLKLPEGSEISNQATWTYGMSVSMNECLKINGFDEVYDGSFGGTDMDFGRRLAMVSRYKRKAGPMVYEFSHYVEQDKRPKIRNDEILRGICNQVYRPVNIRANTWKPTEEEREKYVMWHNMNYDSLDPNWDKFMDVSMFNIKELRKDL